MKNKKKFKKVTEKEIYDTLLQKEEDDFNSSSLATFANYVADGNITISTEIRTLKENLRKLTLIQSSIGLTLIDLNETLTQELKFKDRK